MSAQDYNNGFITGLALRGLTTVGYRMWEPHDVWNDDTESITIDFGVTLPSSLTLEKITDSLSLYTSYYFQRIPMEPLALERVNNTTIKLTVADFNHCSGHIAISYLNLDSDLGSVPSFVYDFIPENVVSTILTQLIEIINVPITDEEVGCDVIEAVDMNIRNSNNDQLAESISLPVISDYGSTGVSESITIELQIEQE